MVTHDLASLQEGVWTFAHWIEGCERVPAPSRQLAPLPDQDALDRLLVRSVLTTPEVAAEKLARPVMGDSSVIYDHEEDYGTELHFGERYQFEIHRFLVRGLVELELFGYASTRSGEEVVRASRTMFPDAAGIFVDPGPTFAGPHRDPFTGLHRWWIRGIPGGYEITALQFCARHRPVRRMLLVRNLVAMLHEKVPSAVEG